MSVVGALERYVLQKVPVMVREPGGRIAEWSGGMQKLYSYSAAQAIGQIAQDLLRTEFPKPLPRIEEEVRDTGHWRGELQEARASGEALVVRSEWSLIDDLGSDASDRFMVWNADVTALSRTQADLQFLASIVEGSQDAVISKDLSGTITSWNKAAEDIFGYAANEIVGQPVLTLFPEDLFEEEQMILAKLKRGERIDHYETTRVHKDGHEFYVSLTLSPIRDRSGRIIGASKIVRDVTERKQLRSSLEEVQAELLHVSRLNDMGPSGLRSRPRTQSAIVCRKPVSRRRKTANCSGEGSERSRGLRKGRGPNRSCRRSHQTLERFCREGGIRNSKRGFGPSVAGGSRTGPPWQSGFDRG